MTMPTTTQPLAIEVVEENDNNVLVNTNLTLLVKKKRVEELMKRIMEILPNLEF